MCKVYYITGCFFFCNMLMSQVTIVNPSFEYSGADVKINNWDKIAGWNCDPGENSGIEKNPFYAPVHGEWIAWQKGDGVFITQNTQQIIKAHKKYTLKLWVRCINEAGNIAETIVETRFFTDSGTIISTQRKVNAPQLKGAAAQYFNDDGANVWIDGEYRHQLNDKHMYQPLSSDPINDPWLIVENNNYEKIEKLGWAVGNVIAGKNKFVYGTLYRDKPGNFYSSITMSKVLSTEGNNYTWSKPIILISHAKSEFPWVEDPHVYYDKSSDRLWLSWGGGTCYVSELNPETGLFLNHQDDPEFDTHPKEMHHAVASWPETHQGWCGDRYSSCWMEGAALYKHNDFWYYFASYGNMNTNYTIRYGRGNSPIGPFFDRQGLKLTEFEAQRKQYGNTILLGAEGNQLVPGHPHLWEENGTYYLGYDYRSDLSKEEDKMGIRHIYWVNDWPTIYMPVSVSFNSNDYPEIIGKELGISFRNAGDKESLMAVDSVTIRVAEVK